MELLSTLDIIRPFMLQRLIDIRNIVEHQDSKPPSTDDCHMYADLVWYFLRSTDGLTYIRGDAILLEPPGADIMPRNERPGVELMFGDLGKSPIIRMWLNAPGFMYEPNQNWMKIQPIEIIGDENGDKGAPLISTFTERYAGLKINYCGYINSISRLADAVRACRLTDMNRPGFS